MDLGAYVNMMKSEDILKANGIEVPRLRGYRLMAKETPIPEKEIEASAKDVGKYYLDKCKLGPLCYPKKDRWYRDLDKRQARGQARRAYRRVRKQLETFNKYCGRSDVLYVHARIGGWNWKAFGGTVVTKNPRFLEKCDDGFDQTYCDIYFHIGETNQ